MSATRRDRFEAIYRAHHGAVRGYLLRRAEPELAQDALSARGARPRDRRADRFVPGGPGRELSRARIEYLRCAPPPVTDENKALLDMGDHPGARRMRG